MNLSLNMEKLKCGSLNQNPVAEKLKSDCRVTIDTRSASDFEFSIKQIFCWLYASRNVWTNYILQSLGSLTHNKLV